MEEMQGHWYSGVLLSDYGGLECAADAVKTAE